MLLSQEQKLGTVFHLIKPWFLTLESMKCRIRTKMIELESPDSNGDMTQDAATNRKR